jgi:hypothetical protein
MASFILKRHPLVPSSAQRKQLAFEGSVWLGITESELQGSGVTGVKPEPPVICLGSTDVDGNDLLSYWPALGECEAAPCALQTWGSERRLGLDTSKDAANNNQPDLALTSGDETTLGRAQRQRKGMVPDSWPALQEPRAANAKTQEVLAS